MEEEHSGEDGYLSSLDKIAKAEINARLKEIKTDKDAKEEIAVLKQWLKLSDKQSELKRSIKEQDAALDQLTHDKYARLSQEDVKNIVVDDKWLAKLAAEVQAELDRVSQTLTSRIRQLAERYDTPLPELVDEVAALAKKVDSHLKKMGMIWN